MDRPNRRKFLARLGGAAIALSRPLEAAAQTSPTFELVIAGGRVIDPMQKHSAVRDIAISAGAITRVAENLPRAQAREFFDARGKIVTPGLIDVHGHVYDGVATASIDADGAGIAKGVTTIVDAGSAGAVTFP